MTDYYTIEKVGIAEFKDRGSKFIATAFPMATALEFKTKLNELKKEHPKAVHLCFAYRIGTKGDEFRLNDDGEPSGSAGKPILGQIDSKKLINVGIIVIRYFGGTLLGVPGLINAYKTAAALCLQTIPVVQKPIMIQFQVEFDYNAQNEVMQLLKQCKCEILESNINLFSILKFGVPVVREQELVFKIKEMRNIELKKILC